MTTVWQFARDRRRVALWLGSVVGMIGALTFIGRTLGFTDKYFIAGSLVSMKASTALEMLLCGSSLASVARGWGGAAGRLWVRVSASAVVAIAAVVLCEYCFGLERSFFQRLFHEIGGSSRMSAASSFTFILTGVALWLVSNPVESRFTTSVIAALGLAVVVVGLIAIAGYVLKEVFGLGSWNYTGMAVSTAVQFVLLGVGLVALLAERGNLTWSLDALTTWGFMVGVVVLAAAAGISYHFTSQLQDSAGLVNSTQEVLEEITEVTAEVASIGASVRNYINTGDDGFLNQEGAARSDLSQSIEKLRRLTADSPEQGSRLSELGALIGQRINFGERTVVARRQKGLSAAEQLIATGQGVAISEKIRQVTKEIEQAEYSLLQKRQKAEQATASTTFLLLPMGVLLSVTLLSVGLLFLNSGVGERMRAEKRANWLASFPERNPDPIVELDLGLGVIDYQNASSMRILPDLRDRGLSHPWLAGLNEAEAVLAEDPQRAIRSEIIVAGRFFAQTINYIPDTKKVRVYGTDITEHKQVEAAAARLAAIVESSEDAIIGEDLRSVITSWNFGAEKIFGYEAGEIVGQLITRLLPVDRRHEEEEIVNRIKRGESVPQFETVRLRKDGKAIYVSITVSPIRDSTGKVIGASKVARDITARRQSEEALLASEERFRQFADNISEAFWIAAADGSQMLYISPAYEKIWGRSCESLYEEPASFLQTVYEEDRAQTQSAFRSLAKGDSIDIEHRIIGRGGQVRWLHTRGAPIRNEDGAVYRVAGIAEDISRRKETEQQLRQAQKMEAIGKLAGGVAHDFNNVVAVIGANLELLLATEKNLSPEARDYLAHIGHAAGVSATLNRQLLAFSRDDAIQMQVLDLNELVTSFTKMLRRIVGEDIQVRNNLLSGLPPIKADPGMIEQVLMNLAVNSRDAMPKGGQLTIGTEITLVGEAKAKTDPRIRPGRHICLSVRDTGSGIAPEVLPRIFEPFFTTKASGRGTGLGLATVFSIADQHQGWVEVSSQVGAGTTFRLYLPIAIEHIPVSTSTATEAPRGGVEKILLIEDDKSLRGAVHQALQNYGYTVIAADSGDAAQAVWAEHEEQFDLLLTDMVMPGGMTGVELAELLRGKKPSLRVILTSGYSRELSGSGAAKEKGLTFMHKPFSLRVLAETVRKCLDNS